MEAILNCSTVFVHDYSSIQSLVTLGYGGRKFLKKTITTNEDRNDTNDDDNVVVDTTPEVAELEFMILSDEEVILLI